MIFITIKRMLRNPGLTVCLVVGIAVTVAIAVGIPMYSSTINSRMLVKELQEEGRPPYSFMFRYLGSNSSEIEWKELSRVDEYIFSNAPSVIGLPEQLAARYMATDYFRVFTADVKAYESPNELLDWTSVGFVSELEAHIDIVEGRFPRSVSATDTATASNSKWLPAIEVLVSRDRAEKLGFQVGEAYVLVREQKDIRTGSITKIELTARIAGIWVPHDEGETYWFYSPDSFDDTFIVSEQAFVEIIVPALGKNLYNGLWYFILDGSDLNIEDIPQLLENIRYLKARIASYNSAVSFVLSPEEALKKYRRAAFNLAILLYVFSIPVLILILYFIVLISSMIVERQSNEIALLRSRGSSSLQIVNMYLLENLLLGLIGILLGLIVGRLLARVMGATESFLKFSFREPVRVRESWLILSFGLAAAAVSVFAILSPVFSASKHTIVSYKQERARSLHKPLWQRYFFDYLLLLPLGYGYYTLWRRGTIALVEGSSVSSDPFGNPILFLVPTLFVFTLALLFLRLFPVLMELFSRFGERFKGAPLLLAVRSLARSSSHYMGPLLLLILTTGLASFTASMARTLDGHIVDRAYYESGGDFLLIERGELIGEEDSAPVLGAASSNQQKAFLEEQEEEPHWEFIPVFEYNNLPGVRRAIRVGNYKTLARWSDSAGEGQIVGVDPQEFQRPRSFRSDYSPYPLGLLLAILNQEPSALILERRFFRQNNLRRGERIRLSVYITGGWKEMDFTVAGLLDYFPTAYPDDGPIFLTNLEYLFDQAGGMYAYNIWIQADEGMTTTLLEENLLHRKLPASIDADARGLISEEKHRPERQGFYGLLSVGFAGSAFLTALSFLIYSFISFQRRSIELGVLRSIGLTIKQMVTFLIGEQLTMVTVGVAAGNALGIVASYLFVPYLQVNSSAHPQIPPFVVRIAWLDIAWMLAVFAAMLIGVIAILVGLLMRMKIFQAVKLEEVT